MILSPAHSCGNYLKPAMQAPAIMPPAADSHGPRQPPECNAHIDTGSFPFARAQHQAAVLVSRRRFGAVDSIAVGVLLLASRESETLRNSPVGVAIALLLVAGLLLSRHVYRRMRAEAAANFAYELLRETMDNVTQGVAVFNTQHQLIAWNARFAELRALDPTQLRVGKPLAEILRRAAA